MLNDRESRWIIGTVVGLGLLLAGFVTLLFRVGLFNLPETDPAAQAFAAVLALLGGLVTALLTFVGVLIKVSYDARTVELQRQAEERLRMETCIHAVGLMSTSSGAEAAASQKAGALVALANLGQLEFSLALLQQLWPTEDVTASSAVWLINLALTQPDRDVQQRAGNILLDNAERLKISPHRFEWPSCLDLRWRENLDEDVCEAVLEALLRCLLSSPRDSWDRECRNAIIVDLYLLMSKSRSTMIKSGATMALDVLLRLPEPEELVIIYPGASLKIEELRSTVSASLEDAKGGAPLRIHEMVHALERWAKLQSPQTA